MAYSPSFTATGITGAGLPSRHAGATPGGAPTSGTFEVGDFVIDRSGDLWVCTAAGIPGTWASAGGSGVLTTEGDLLYENATPAPARLPIGSAAGSTGDFLGVSGGLPAWQQVSGQYLCPPTSYAPAAQTFLNAVSSTGTAFGLGTTVAAGSNGGEISTIASWANPSGGVLDVASTTGFPTSGTLYVQASGPTVAVITYTGTSGGNSFTGCAYSSGSATGTVATGGGIALATPAVSTGAFTAPPSGNVVVSANLVVSGISGGSPGFAFGLLDHGASTVRGNWITYQDGTTGVRRSYNFQFLVTGLTPGTSYNFDLAGVVTAGDLVSIYAIGQTSTTPNVTSAGQGAPVVMTVQAV